MHRVYLALTLAAAASGVPSNAQCQPFDVGPVEPSEVSAWRFQADAGVVYLDSSYRRYHGTVRTLGGGVGAALGLARPLNPELALGLSLQGAAAVRAFTLVDGYSASVQDNNSLWLGSVGPSIEYRELRGGLHLVGDVAFAVTGIKGAAAEAGTSPGVGVGAGFGWDFPPGDSAQLALLARANGTQTWDGGTRISGLAAGFFLRLQQPLHH